MRTIHKGRKLEGRREIHGLQVSIENKKGSTRKWYDPHNDEHGETTMLHDYGYFRHTMGDDGDHVDCYVGPDENATMVYVIDQMKAPDFKEHDEDKVMICFSSSKDAKEAYLAHYNDDRFFGGITRMTIDEFKEQEVSKGFPGQENSLGQDNAPKFTYDVEDIRNVEHWLNNVGSLKDKDLIQLSNEIWGEGYRYQKVSADHVRAEIRGYLHDQLELLQTQPQLPQGQDDLPPADQLPHSE